MSRAPTIKSRIDISDAGSCKVALACGIEVGNMYITMRTPLTNEGSDRFAWSLPRFRTVSNLPVSREGMSTSRIQSGKSGNVVQNLSG